MVQGLAVAVGKSLILGSVIVAVGIGLGSGAGKAMVYFCNVGSEAWIAYFSGKGLTDCEWLVPGTAHI